MSIYTVEEVSTHNSAQSCWIIIHGKVYDVTKFLVLHPGGRNVLLKVAGKDASKEFTAFHSKDVLAKYLKLCIGSLKDSKEIPKEVIHYAEGSKWQGFNSIYYKESHRKFRTAVREFVDKELMPYVSEWEEAREVPVEIRKKCGQAGMLCGFVSEWRKEYAPVGIPGGVKPEEYDMFHEFILVEEFSRLASFGVVGNIFVTMSIALPPILNFGSKFLKDKVARECLMGDKQICLCISEPQAGSDVANLQTIAKKTPDGKHYLITGEKKFITNAIWGDYFVVGARTDIGISLFLMEKGMPGLNTRRMNMQGSWASGTSYMTFEDVKVPAEYLIGKEGEGFKYIMYNFNGERWGGVVQTTRVARVCYEEAYRYANKRVTFGKKLIENDVIRSKLGRMASRIECCHAWAEQITYQLNTMPRMEANLKMPGTICLAKVEATQTLEMCAREASQIFGGLAYTRGSQGGRIERIYRDVRVLAIGGGSEEIVEDFAMRMMLKTSKL